MCGIVGYIGPRPAADILLDGLRRLEYRGYDSAGLAIVNGAGVSVRKASGKIAVLTDLVLHDKPAGSTGIGHTRWATHGAPTTPNAHPHTDCTGHLALIHNGIIENAAALRTVLSQRGSVFASETDAEVLAHLIGAYYEGSLEEAVAIGTTLIMLSSRPSRIRDAIRNDVNVDRTKLIEDLNTMIMEEVERQEGGSPR